MRTVTVLVWVMTAACGKLTPNAQYELGAEAYETYCASCHIPGGTGPALDAKVLGYWRTAGNLNAYNKDQMPYNAGGILTDAQYRDITAFMLRREGLLAGDMVLTEGNMDSIRLIGL